MRTRIFALGCIAVMCLFQMTAQQVPINAQANANPTRSDSPRNEPTPITIQAPSLKPIFGISTLSARSARKSQEVQPQPQPPAQFSVAANMVSVQP